MTDREDCLRYDHMTYNVLHHTWDAKPLTKQTDLATTQNYITWKLSEDVVYLESKKWQNLGILSELLTKPAFFDQRKMVFLWQYPLEPTSVPHVLVFDQL